MVYGRLALLRKGGGPAHRGHEVDVSAAAHAARSHHHPIARMGEVADVVCGLHALRIELAHHRSQGHVQHEVIARLAMAASALSVRAALGAEVMLVAVVDKRRELGVGLKDHRTAVPAVSAVRTALGHEGLAPERHASGAAVTTADVDPA